MAPRYFFQRPIVSVALSPSIAKTLCGWMH